MIIYQDTNTKLYFEALNIKYYKSMICVKYGPQVKKEKTKL